MSLFKKKPKKKPDPDPLFVRSVPYSQSFKGFKRIKLSTFQDPLADAVIEAVKAADDIDQITFKAYRFEGTSGPLLRVYADGNKLGTIWSASYKEYYNLIKAGKCAAASVAFVDAGDVLLFVKF